MKIERVFYGMVNGKMKFDKTDGVNRLLSDSSIEFIRNLKIDASNRYLYFKQEQVIAFPKIIKVFDEKSERAWIQNETRLLSVHDYFELSNVGGHLWQGDELNEVLEFPDQFNPIIV
jgi:hypothetical protein